MRSGWRRITSAGWGSSRRCLGIKNESRRGLLSEKWGEVWPGAIFVFSCFDIIIIDSTLIDFIL